MHGTRFVTRRCKWLGLTWRYWRWWLTKLLLKLLHTWHIWASNRYEAHSSDCKQTEHPQKEQNIELSPKNCCCCKLAFKYDFMQKSIFIKNEYSRLFQRCIYTTHYFCNIYLLVFWAFVACEAHFHHLHHKWLLCLQTKVAQYIELNISICSYRHTVKNPLFRPLVNK